MRNKRRKMWLCSFLSVASFVLIAFIAVCMSRTAVASKSVTEAAAEERLRALDIPDAVLTERYTNEADGKDYYLYRSEKTGYEYHFYVETGELAQMEWIEPPKTEMGVERIDENKAAISDEERYKIAIDFAEKYIAPYQIGELVLELDHYTNFCYFMNFMEEYQGERTGTNVFLTCMPDGTITDCRVARGEIFQKDESGAITVADSRPLIGEEAAIAAACGVAEARIAQDGGTLDESSIVCSLRAHENKRYYRVVLTISAIWFEEYGEAIDSEYTIQIDAYTGEVLEAAKTI